MSITSEDKQRIKNLIVLGKKQGYITHDDILDLFPEVEENLHLLEYIIGSLQDNDIEIIEPQEGDLGYGPAAAGKMTFEEKIKILKQIRSHISTDPIRAYLQEIGRIPLLSAEEEVILAKRIEDSEKDFTRIIKELGVKKLDPIYEKAGKQLEKGIIRNPAIDAAKKEFRTKTENI